VATGVEGLMTPAIKAQCLEQIRRDMAVLKEDSVYHSPSKAFFERRIRAYRRDILEGAK